MEKEWKEYMDSFNEKVCGYTNMDTFRAILNIDNVYDCYKYVSGNKETLLKLTDLDLLDRLKRLKTKDKINWNRVNLEEVKERLRDY